MGWAYELDGPGVVRRVEREEEAAPLRPGQVRLRLLAAGLCGSDMPPLLHVATASDRGWHEGAPVHEVVGEVVESASPRLRVGQRVVGTGGAGQGLREHLVESDTTLIEVPDDLDDADAVPIQSVATVIRAANTLPDVTGRAVAVIGAGPIGLAFVHLLRHRGAGEITVVDPVPREEVARHYGADVVVQAPSRLWLDGLDRSRRPAVVVEAVGHQQATLRDALRAVADRGFVLGFGAVDDEEYVVPYREMYERGLTLSTGRTKEDWVGVLEAGRDHLQRHRADFEGYLSHRVPMSDAQTAYALYARPQTGRLKVALVAG
jgi:L-iditol 2-dehydrogenase